MQVDYDNRKVEMERGYVDITRKNDLDARDRISMA